MAGTELIGTEKAGTELTGTELARSELSGTEMTLDRKGSTELTQTKGNSTLKNNNPHVLSQEKLVFVGGQNPPRLSLLRQIQKGHVTSLSLFSSSLSKPQTSLSITILWHTHLKHSLLLSLPI